ncbi:TPA: AAA domain-containing protein [Pseudomonas aeruginosa]|nr:DNA helicase [Pseudomonas aeruginosa]EIU2864208.1 DNA helicase [Pseudomonas aeruginosa]HEK3716946.1 DNA helicase [Pseudomonas aeruginosa]
MPPRTTEQSAIIRFWHSVELLSPQSVPKLTTIRKPGPIFVHEIPRSSAGSLVLPWSPYSPVAKRETTPGKRWSHQIYGRCFDYGKIVERLEAQYKAKNGYRETKETIVGLYSLRFSDRGEFIPDSFVLSSAAWFAGRIGRTADDWLTGFDEAQSEAAKIAAEVLEGPVTSDVLEQLTEKLLEMIDLEAFFKPLPKRYVCNSVLKKASGTEPADDPLNSFILGDLAHVARSVASGTTSVALDEYLSIHDPANRTDLSKDSSSADQRYLLAPEMYPDGCWPTPKDIGLVHSQQLAVNGIHWMLKANGLLSVNGPPGTGKTTLLRDIVAAVVTTRADALAALPAASDAFTSKGSVIDDNRNINYWTLPPGLLGHEIVVASSNNGAIENVTLELPQRDKVDASWLTQYDQFADIASLVTGQPAWGLISAPLGSKSRRSSFLSAFWSGTAKTDIADKGLDPDAPADGTDYEVNTASSSKPAVSGLAAEGGSDAAQTGAMHAAPEKVVQRKGMEAWLNSQPKRSKAEKVELWRAAVGRYLTAKQAAVQASKDALRINSLFREAKAASDQVSALKQSLDAKVVPALEIELHTTTATSQAAESQLQASLQTMSQVLSRRPGFLANLFTLWAAGRRWAQEESHARAQQELAQGRYRRIEREILQLKEKLQAERAAIAKKEADIATATGQVSSLIEELQALAERFGASHLVTYLRTGVIGRGESIELAEPWIIPGWRRARSKVFLEAMQLHKTLFELEPQKAWTNLTMAKTVLEGARFRNLPREAVRSIWGTLFMAVPVVSSTFSSFARCFSTLGAGELGWLLVDEAGQASPQAAVGALWRSQRAVMVGDPLQLEPINQVPPGALEHMRSAFGVDLHWMPHQLSAQSLADQANPIGREIGPAGNKVWVGMPLVVHRRCDLPMFKVANRIAYDGVMVYGTAPRVPDIPASLTTGWVQAGGESSGNWVPAEGRALKLLISLLTLEGVDPKSISVITPFSDVIREVSGGTLSRMGVTTGTIHTMQGRESDVVVLVLGGEADPQRSGAREWVVEKANMLNVAATRAKRRFYVIGDRADWSKRRYFDQIMDLLPEVNVEAALARYQGTEEEGDPWWSTQDLLDQIRIGHPSPVGAGTSGGPVPSGVTIRPLAPGESWWPDPEHWG